MATMNMDNMSPITKRLYPGQPKRRKKTKGYPSLATALKMKVKGK